MPKSWASCNASFVGADLDRTISHPIFETLSKISDEIRPLNAMIFPLMDISLRKQ